MDLIDIGMLESIYELGEELHDELLQMFEEEFEPRLERIQHSIESGDDKSLASYAHSLKGSCGTIGASELRRISFDLERTGKSGMVPQNLDSIESLRAIYDQTMKAFREYKANRGSLPQS